MKRRTERQHMKKRKLRKFSIFIILAVLLMVGFGGHYAFKTYQAASQSFDDLGRDKSAKREDAVSISKDPISILLMGVDDTEEMENGRTDTLIVATFNPSDERLKLLSIPRDRKSTRLNSSHVAISYAVFCLKKKKNNMTPLASCTLYTSS